MWNRGGSKYSIPEFNHTTGSWGILGVGRLHLLKLPWLRNSDRDVLPRNGSQRGSPCLQLSDYDLFQISASLHPRSGQEWNYGTPSLNGWNLLLAHTSSQERWSYSDYPRVDLLSCVLLDPALPVQSEIFLKFTTKPVADSYSAREVSPHRQNSYLAIFVNSRYNGC